MKMSSLLLLALLVPTSAFSAPYEVSRSVEGPYTFKLFGVELNKGSSLQRESILLNEPSCPVQVSSNAMTFGYKNSQLNLSSSTGLSIGQPVMALEVRHVLFDVFGQHLQNLSNLEVQDIPAGSKQLEATWNPYDDNLTQKLLTTVTYVARARLADGTQWVCNDDNLLSALGTLHLEKVLADDKRPGGTR